MTGYRSHGYDIAVQLSEHELNEQLGPYLPLALLGCSGDYPDIPTSEGTVSAHCGFGAASGAAAIELDTSVANGIQVSLPFELHGTFSSPATWPTEDDFLGDVSVTPELVVRADGDTRCVVLDLDGMTPDRVQVTDLELSADWAGHEDAVREWIEQVVLTCLQRQGELDLGIHIPVDTDSSGEDPWMPVDADVRVVTEDGSSCVALLLPTSPETPRDAAGYAKSAVGPGEELVLILGNRMILHRVMAQSMLQMLGIPDPDNPLELATADDLMEFTGTETTLREPVSLDHLFSEWWLDEVRLEGMQLSVTEEERVELSAHAHAVGVAGAFTGDIHVSAWLEVESVTDNVVTFRVHLDEPELELELEWWVFLLLAVVLGPLGGVLAGLVQVVVDPLVEGFLWGLIGSFASAELPAGEEWPEHGPVEFRFTIDLTQELPPLPMDLEIDSVVLDDWGLIGGPAGWDPAYEWPAPSLSISGEMDEVSSEGGGIKRSGHMGRVSWTIFGVEHAHRGIFRAVPQMLAYPIDFEWSLAGEILAGNGSLDVDGVEVTFGVDGDRCELSLDAGESLEAELALNAVDQRGVELFATRWLSVEGETTHGLFTGEELLDPSFIYQGPGALLDAGPSPAEEMTFDAHMSMVSKAVIRGMGVDPWETSQPEEPR